MIIGFNGTNTAEVLTPEVIGYVSDLVPVGGELCYRIRADKYAAKMPDSAINNIIALNDYMLSQGKYLKVIYTFYTRPDPILSLSDNFYGFNKLRIAGLDIIAAEMGNEEWAKVANHNQLWSNFKSIFDPIVSELKSIGFTGKIIFPVSFGSEDRTQSIWNAAGAAYINLDSQFEPVIHLYYKKDEVPVMQEYPETLPSVTVNTTYLPTHDSFYKDLANQVIASNLLPNTILEVQAACPGKKMWVTEYGPTTNVGNIQNTLGYEIGHFKVLLEANEYKDYIAVMCKHNGPTTPLTGIISTKKNMDDINTSYVKRASYYTLQLFAHNIETGLIPFFKTNIYNPYLPPHIHNVGDIKGISASYYYSSAGQCEWWTSGSPKSYEINGSTSFDNFPLIGFGFYTPIYKVYGCTNPDALNFNPDATDDDGSCVMPIYGCTNPDALNYNPEANVDDGSCVLKVYGCTDSKALNYNPEANVDDGSCILPVLGCTNPDALNFNPEANVDDGSCILKVYGCTNSEALNYNPEANVDDGSCVMPIYGCTNPDALNYNPEANVDDGSCVLKVYGCTNPDALNYNPEANVDDGSCVLKIYGCTDPKALNYNPNANVNDGSCQYKAKESTWCKIRRFFGLPCS